jgi:hypothetical protein
MKSGPDALGIAENASSVLLLIPPETGSGEQNMKTGPDVLGIDENEYESAKYENCSSRLRYSRKRVRERKTLKRDPTHSVPSKMSSGAQTMKTGPNALGTAENEFGSTKHENGTHRSRYRRKRVRKRET